VPQTLEALADAGDAVLVVGNPELARGNLERIVALGRTLRASASPDERRRLKTLGYRKVGDARRMQGDRQHALEGYQEAADQLELVAGRSSDDSELQRDLAQGHELTPISACVPVD
jgi:hypothetical protein